MMKRGIHLLALSALLTVFGCDRPEPGQHAPPPDVGVSVQSATSSQTSGGPAIARLVEQERQRRQAFDETLWAEEVEAQHYEQYVIDLWDRLRANEDTYGLLSALSFESMTLPTLGPSIELALGINERYATPEAVTWTMPQWREQLKAFENSGFRLVQSEWHHDTFDRDQGQKLSTFSMLLHIDNPDEESYSQIKGSFDVVWHEEPTPQGVFVPRSITFKKLSVLTRNARPAFRHVLRLSTDNLPAPWPRDNAPLMQDFGPVLVYDFNRDGLSEIALAGRNILLTPDTNLTMKMSNLSSYAMPRASAAVVGDFTGDGFVDYVCAGNAIPYPLLYPGNSNGQFRTEPRPVDVGGVDLSHAMAMTAGDIDADGDLDLWISQFDPAYAKGSMPTPYFDANDGPPACLLINDGSGRFQEKTAQRGLASKRHRRTYAASFVDLDDDRDLDLLVTSDFAGIDTYLNDGTGHFREATEELVGESANFGMSHTFADFDLDGAMDFYVTGMGSTTARRLERMNLKRDDLPEYDAMRMKMAYGNRMYLRRTSRYEEPPFRDQVARTGWSWGSTAFDFDNDADADLFVANGHQTGSTAKDYCTYFWRHDIYCEKPGPDDVMRSFYEEQMRLINNPRGMSWNGFEKNKLLMNRSGKSFTDVGFMMGVATEHDGRQVISDDLNGDGLKDLIVTEEDIQWGPRRAEVKYTLHIYMNQVPSTNHWVGIRLQEEAGRSPLGAKVTVQHGEQRQVDAILSGDSYSSQHALTAHFGLGQDTTIDWLEVEWVDGEKVRLDSPAIDTYHTVRFQ